MKYAVATSRQSARVIGLLGAACGWWIGVTYQLRNFGWSEIKFSTNLPTIVGWSESCRQTNQPWQDATIAGMVRSRAKPTGRPRRRRPQDGEKLLGSDPPPSRPRPRETQRRERLSQQGAPPLGSDQPPSTTLIPTSTIGPRSWQVGVGRWGDWTGESQQTARLQQSAPQPYEEKELLTFPPACRPAAAR